jgi:periplasmic mercuric ion binding protein
MDSKMLRFSLITLALCASFVGCKPATETVPKVTNPKVGSSGTTGDPAPVGGTDTKPAEEAPPTEPAPAGSSSTNTGNAVRFVADKKLEVPAMMCPYGCYPSVEKALASVPGVVAVQLAEQPAGTKEGEIALKVVELKLGEGFNLAAAIAALKKAEFEASELN